MLHLCPKRIGNCTHDKNQRGFIGTWVAEEIKKTELGCQILDIFEVWHYEQKSPYDPKTKQVLYSEYISNFQGQKQEASGCPEHVDDEEMKDKYIKKYQERGRVALRKDDQIQYWFKESREAETKQSIGIICTKL